jgi:hypothetical protein
MKLTTEDLILTLAADLKPVARYAVLERLGKGVLSGLLVTTALVVTVWGVRPDLTLAVYGIPFWMKWAYTMSLGVAAIFAVSRLARPDPESLVMLWVLAVPVLALAGCAAHELANTPWDHWRTLWMGNSWMSCSRVVLVLSVPVFLGLLWSFRSFAPTRLRTTGALAGLASGAWAATVYGLHCPEPAAIFVLTWYSLGILLAAALGAALGPYVLRW